MNKKTILLSALAMAFVSSEAVAEVQVRTFESRVVQVPPTDTTTTTYRYKVVGPDKIEYELEGSPSEIARLSETIKTQPNAVIRFDGDVVDGQRKVFKVKNWETHTSTETDAFGNKTTTTTTQETTQTR